MMKVPSIHDRSYCTPLTGGGQHGVGIGSAAVAGTRESCVIFRFLGLPARFEPCGKLCQKAMPERENRAHFFLGVSQKSRRGVFGVGASTTVRGGLAVG